MVIQNEDKTSQSVSQSSGGWQAGIFALVLYFLPLHDLLHDVLACTGATQNSANNAGILTPLPRTGWLGTAADTFLCSAMVSLAQGSQGAPGLTQAEPASAARVCQQIRAQGPWEEELWL